MGPFGGRQKVEKTAYSSILYCRQFSPTVLPYPDKPGENNLWYYVYNTYPRVAPIVAAPIAQKRILQFLSVSARNEYLRKAINAKTISKGKRNVGFYLINKVDGTNKPSNQ